MIANRFLLLVFCLVFGIACKRSIPVSNNSKPPVTSTANEPTSKQVSSEDKILFVNIECFKKRNGEDTCVVLNTMEVNGKFKETESSSHAHGEEVNEYKCSLLSCTGEVLYEEHLDNPLSKHMDTYEESGKIEHKEVNFERAEFSLRVQKKAADYCRLKIEKIKNNSTSIISNSPLRK